MNKKGERKKSAPFFAVLIKWEGTAPGVLLICRSKIAELRTALLKTYRKKDTDFLRQLVRHEIPELVQVIEDFTDALRFLCDRWAWRLTLV